MRVQDPKWQIKAKPMWHHFEGKIDWSGLKTKRAQNESSWVGEPKMQARVQGKAQLKDSICFK
jgi:hypothetical protein